MNRIGAAACRLLFRSYPPHVRAGYGAEMLTTLADAAGEPGGSLPRELGALAVGSLRAHGALAAGGAAPTAKATWRAGARLGALLLLLLAATWNGYELAARGLYQPLGLAAWSGLEPRGWLPAATTLRLAAAVAVPLAAAVLLCIGRLRLAAATAVGWLLLYQLGVVGAVLVPGLIAPAGGDPAATPLVQAVRLALLAFVAAPALLLLLAGGLRSARAPRHAIAWLLVPVLLVVLHLWFWATTLTFWPLGVLFVAWFVLAPVDVRLTIAALVAGVPLVAVVVATALGAPEYEYALPVAAGLACLVAASLATAFARRPPERARD